MSIMGLRDNGLAIGLFGGSFNPAHDGHMHVALTGLNQLQLDQIWWMVSPQNPLKSQQPPYENRVKTVDDLGLPHRMQISHMERDFGTQYTVDMLRKAKAKWPRSRFIFLMGEDNFKQLPKWKHWREIMDLAPIAVVSRPDSNGTARIRARLGQAARMYANARVPEERADILKNTPAPAWTFLTPPHNAASSTAIRNARLKG